MLSALSATAAAMAGPPLSANWWAPAEARIRAIYDRGELRAKPFDGTWLPDSSGYVLRAPEQAGQGEKAVFDVTTGAQRRDADPAQLLQTADPRRSPDGRYVIEHRRGDLVVIDSQSGAESTLLRRPQERDVDYEFSQWSADSRHIVFIESDETDVPRRAVLSPTDPSYPTVERNRFARIGGPIPALRVGIVGIDALNPRWLPLPVPEEGYYLGQVEWAGNPDEVLVETFSRFRDQRRFCLYSVATDTLTCIYEETNSAWADASQGLNSRLMWIADGKQFIVLSEKGAWRQAFLHRRTGEQLAELTPVGLDVIARGNVDEGAGYFYFYASPENATQKYLYRTPLDGGGAIQRVTPDDQSGTHDYVFSPDGKWAFHTWSTFDTPPVTELVELPSHRVVRLLEQNATLHAQAREWIREPTEFFTLPIAADVTCDAWMIKPPGFDPTKKYPVFVYVYGEPHAQTVLDSWGAAQSHFHRVVAEQGYLVVSIDNRGTPAPKGTAWRRAIFGSLGPLSTAEQAAALQELGRSRPYVDLSRVGIWGWSGGGSNTLNAMFRQPDLYHVGIAVVPKPQPQLYNAWFQEIYMRTPQVNPDGYERSAPINFASGLKGDLLIVTGSGETNTHIQIIEGLVDRLIELGKPFDYMVYPNRDHGLREGPGSEVHVRMLILRYLVTHLTPGPAA